jgi:hypothetical protein
MFEACCARNYTIPVVHVRYLLNSSVHFKVLSAYKYDFEVTEASIQELRIEYACNYIMEASWTVCGKHMHYDLFPCGKDDYALVKTLKRCCDSVQDFSFNMTSSVL